MLQSIESCLTSALSDPELGRLAPGLTLTVTLVGSGWSVTFGFDQGGAQMGPVALAPLVQVEASDETWSKVLAAPPPPRHQSFTAFQIANPQMVVTGDPETIARARAALERVFEIITASPVAAAEKVRRDHGQIVGRYAEIKVAGQSYPIYHEAAGQGLPIVFLHTAGADGRQYLGQLADTDLAGRYRMYAPDMPFHGRSLPPEGWDGRAYRLTSNLYRDWVTAYIDQIVGEPVVLVGGSMGAAMALVMAAERPDRLRGIVAVEPPFRSRGRRNPYQAHVGVHGGLHNGAYVRGLMSPTSPLHQRRLAAWIYSQGAPGIYPGDLAFYSDDFDGAVTAPAIKGVPVALLSGTYDYSATPEDGAKLADLIPGALHVVMEGLGHFPMIEHPDLFRPHLLAGLDHLGR